jgi:hypothetical protein
MVIKLYEVHMPTQAYIQRLQSLLSQQQYETFGVTDYLSFPGSVNPEKLDQVVANYKNTFDRPHAEQVQLRLFTPRTSSEFKRVARDIQGKKFSECSNFAYSAAGVILDAMEKGELEGDFNVTVAGISSLQNHNVVIIYPKDIPTPKTMADFKKYKNEILIVDPWAYALGWGESCVYPPKDFPLRSMLSRATTHYQSKNDESHLEKMMELSANVTPEIHSPEEREQQPVQQRIEPSQPIVMQPTAQTPTEQEPLIAEPKKTGSSFTQLLFYMGLAAAGAGTIVTALLAWPAISASLVSAGIISASGISAASTTASATALTGATLAGGVSFFSTPGKEKGEDVIPPSGQQNRRC